MGGAGGFLSQPVPDAQSRTYCLSKLGCPRPTSYWSAGQKREEAGGQTSSPRAGAPKRRGSRGAALGPGGELAVGVEPELELRVGEDDPALARMRGDRAVD